MILLLVTIVFFAGYILLIGYYYRGWKATPLWKMDTTASTPFVSLIIPARNESQHMNALLEALQKQSYPKEFFEIILVDDFSTDDTAIRARQRGLSNLTVIQPSADSRHSSKKKAIESGIAKAKGELVITTDADCLPPPYWVENLARFHAQKGASFIAAPVKFTHNNSLLQIFQSLDFLTLQGITAASVTTGFHTMCNGANLAYRKTSFEEVNGFEGIDHVASGDDLLLMYKIWKKDPSKVFYLKSKEAIVRTEPMLSWKEFLMQRKRWGSKSLVYDDYRIIAVLLFVFLFNALFITWIIAAFFDPLRWSVVLLFWILKTLVELPFISSVARFYGEEKILRWFFFFQPLHILYTVFVGLLSQFGTYEWKGRRTK